MGWTFQKEERYRRDMDISTGKYGRQSAENLRKLYGTMPMLCSEY